MAKALPKDHLFFEMGHTLTDEQRDFRDAIYSDDVDVIFCNAAAGTGKTTIAVATAKILHAEGRYSGGLLYVFNPVEENKMGFRPGTQYDKEQEYTIPLDNALVKIREQPDKAKYNPSDAMQCKQKANTAWVEATSHIFARGTNQEKKIVIIDEAQNWTVPQLKKMLTRCHDNSKVIVIGHTGQCDLPNPHDSGFDRYIEHYRNQERARICTLSKNFRGWIANHADQLN